jgi:hypothetical protein
VELPIWIRAYIHKMTNRPAFSMTIAKQFEKGADENGEVF